MFQKVAESDFIRGEHAVLRFWREAEVFQKLRAKNAGKPRWSFLDGPITANNPMGVHHAWGRTYKDACQRYFAMTGHDLRYQNGFDCQGLWVEVEVEKELKLGTKRAIEEFGIDRFVNECKRRVLRFAARQTEQSIRLGYWMDWDDPDTLRRLAEHIGQGDPVTITTPSGRQVTDAAHRLVARLGNAEWGGSYFTFATENNETIWTFLKKCHERHKIYQGYDVMPWSGRGGSAYSQMEVADGRRLSVHKSVFVRLPIVGRVEGAGLRVEGQTVEDLHNPLHQPAGHNPNEPPSKEAYHEPEGGESPAEYLLIWTTTPWTLTSNVAAAVNPDLEYVKLRAKRDGAVYYFAKENLEYERLGREFREGFGRPEWSWPEGVPKLKTLAQIFKEQGGFEVAGTVRGADLLGWRYVGPFDDLPAQQAPGGVPAEEGLAHLNGVRCHRVIDGGRDSKGNPHVVAGEGTGIVHIAPGCGDVDYQLGKQRGLVSIAPLEEDGRFTQGFGEFTGREAIDPATADLVIAQLREKGLLVAVEDYPHIYPHCWRTGDELVFRLVDEWFINMDWREEIKNVTRQIRWLPESIGGRERELEWLDNMRDWMISKKRFWGLALPIWVNPDDPEDFEVIGSLAELRKRAVEGGAGWPEFEGHTPHRPWIDRVKIRSRKSGAVLSRIVDVGNPWLDAGIVPFSTMQYNSDRDAWRKWYPADFVTECFPGQFRNWFYSLLAMATMMDASPPFKTLLGHRLVMDEDGRPMHKSDGTAIWFEEAAEQLGVDTMRWMYLAQNPAIDLRFGKRHPEQPVAIETPDGRIDQTREGEPTCLVTSKPSDEIRRQILIPLWNSYAFFVNYARLDEFDPSSQPVPVAERPEIDRWILSNLQALIAGSRRAFESFDVAAVCASAARFIDDLSNWYIRRNRRRFWRSKDAGDRDKLAAYQTLYEVLVTLTQIVAPIVPFLAERMYQNLVHGVDLAAPPSAASLSAREAPASVHLCEYPTPNDALLDPDLNERMATAQLVVRLGHKLRDLWNLRVRLPLKELRYVTANRSQRTAVDSLRDIILEELNVRELVVVERLDDVLRYAVKPNKKTLGPKYGKRLPAIQQQLADTPPEALARLRRGESVAIIVAGDEVVLGPQDVIWEQQATEWNSAAEAGIELALHVKPDESLEAEGTARDFVRLVQNTRRAENLEMQDRIEIRYRLSESEHLPVVRSVHDSIERHKAYIMGETLADSLERETPTEVFATNRSGGGRVQYEGDDVTVTILLRRV